MQCLSLSAVFTQKSKHILAQVFLVAFLLIKVSGLHAFVHHHDPAEMEKCVLCHMSARDSITPIMTSDNAVEVTIWVKKTYPQVINHYQSVNIENFKFRQFTNRAPPFYTVS